MLTTYTEGSYMKNYIGISRDHSGSMRSIALAAGRDYNDNIASIKENSAEYGIDTIVSVVKCGVGYMAENIMEATNSSITKLSPIKDGEYVADGNATPLFDSVMMLIGQMSAVPDANDPEVSFVVMVVTDGQDNSSRTSGPRLAERIKLLQASDRWTFVFRVPRGYKRELTKYGIPEGNILEWDQTDKGVQQASVVTRSAVKSFYAARSTGTKSTDKFYTDMSDVSINEVKKTLVDISGEILVFKTKSTEGGIQIRDFVEQRTKKPMVKGSAFYQLTKTETVQDYKLIAIRDKTTLAFYSGDAARDMLGLPRTGEIKLAPGAHGQYDIFIQSTSINRKLVENTNVLVWDNAGV